MSKRQQSSHGKEKSFANKKNSATFCLVCRDSSSMFSDPFGFLGDGDRVFKRVDDGTNYVPEGSLRLFLVGNPRWNPY